MVSDICYFHLYLGKWSNLTKTFQLGWNQQLVKICWKKMMTHSLLKSAGPKTIIAPYFCFGVNQICTIFYICTHNNPLVLAGWIINSAGSSDGFTRWNGGFWVSKLFGSLETSKSEMVKNSSNKLEWFRFSTFLPSKRSKWATPPKFNSSPLQHDGWKTILSYWVSVTFQGRAAKLREGTILLENPPTFS